LQPTTKKVDATIYRSIVDITEKALKEVYKDKPKMGKVYISPEIAHCKVPNGTRDASMSSAPMSKGSRLPLAGNANVVRGFIWWTNIEDKNSISTIPEYASEKEYIDFVKKSHNEGKHFSTDSFNELMYRLGAENISVTEWGTRVYKPFDQIQYVGYGRNYDRYCSNTIRNLVKKYPELNAAAHQTRGNDHFRVDVDLSAAMMDKNLKLISRCSFYDLSGQCYTHSGDIVDGGDANGAGVAEFIDIDLNKAKEQGVRYFVFTVHSYTSQTYAQMEHMHFGFMEREEQEKGEIFEPSTVSQKVKLNAPSTSATVCMFDIEKREMIWMDEVGQDIFKPWHRNNTVDANWHGTSMVCYKALHMEKPNLDDVIRVNVDARGGEIVYDKDEADLVFDLNEGITPTDIDYFSGELIPAEVAPEYIAKEEDETIAPDEQTIETIEPQNEER
jgi:stress response protein SCP2